MFNFIAKRLLQVIPLLLIIMTLTFFIMRLAPGNPFANERQLSAEVRANMERRFGLDRPMFYFSWPLKWNGFDNQYNTYFVGRNVKEPDGSTRWEWGVLGGNFGPSTRFTDARSVTEVILTGLPLSLALGFTAYLLAILIGIPIGIIAGYKQNSGMDYASMAIAMIGISVPALVLGPLLVLTFALSIYWFPPALMDWIQLGPIWLPNPRYLLLPAIALSAVYAAYIARLTRAGMLETLRADYVRTARAKGLDEKTVILKHALRGALLPVVSFTGPALAFLLGGTIVVERIFALGGLGTFFIQAANNRDYTLTLGIVFFVAAVLIIMNLLVDIAYAYIDPRIKYS